MYRARRLIKGNAIQKLFNPDLFFDKIHQVITDETNIFVISISSISY